MCFKKSSIRVTRFWNEQNIHYVLLQPGNTLSKRATYTLLSLHCFAFCILANKCLVDDVVMVVVGKEHWKSKSVLFHLLGTVILKCINFLLKELPLQISLRLCFCYLQQSIKREKEYLLHQTYAIFDSPGCWLFLSCGEKHLSIAAHQVFWLLWQSFLPWFKQQRRNHGTNNMSYRIAERIRRYVLGLEPLNPPQTLRTPCLCLRTNVASPGKKPVAQPKLIA